MRELVFHPRLRLLRITAFCLLVLMVAVGAALADASPASREFWLSNRHPTKPEFRTVHATLRASGKRSAIYVEDSLWGGGLTAEFLNRLEAQIETAAPKGAVLPGLGVLTLEENFFGMLPRKISPDGGLIILFADLGPSEDLSKNGFYNPVDQLSDSEARARLHQRSNEANLIYVNGFRKDEARTLTVVARELQRLLAGNSEKELWLSESLSEGALMLTGLFSSQGRVNSFARNPGQFPLVSDAPVQLGAQLLFASFLLDSIPMASPNMISAIARAPEAGRQAVERVYREQTDTPLTFDAIYSNFVSYVFAQASQKNILPTSWSHEHGILVPEVEAYIRYRGTSGELRGQVAPYSFIAIDLADELSPTVVIQAQRVDTKDSLSQERCAHSASVLWKPITATRLAIYTVGCDPEGADESVGFLLKILDQPSLLPSSPLRILP